MDMAAICFNGVETFDRIINILSTEGPMLNLIKKCSRGLREEDV